MPLGSRDVLFILRAQDFASREVRNLGRMFGGLGAQMKAQQVMVGDLNNRYSTNRQRLMMLNQAHAAGIDVRGRGLAVQQREIDARKATARQLAIGIRGREAEIEQMQRQAAIAQRNLAVGSAMLAIGAVATVAGAAVTSFFASAVKGAAEFRQGVALAQTQARDMGATVQQLTEIAFDVASKVPRPLEEMHKTLYDIFSSMDVTVEESRTLLDAFARAAVAGQVDTQQAARATIAIMNAYEMQAHEVTDVNDIMFRMVERGVGTYEEFAGSIGRAIPAAVRAGQEFDVLAGMMAFLTRRGLSTEMAATAAARSLELFADPRVVERFEEMGIAVRDATGNFRPFPEVVQEMAKRWGDLPAPERAREQLEVFAGAGYRIQARRFFDTVLPSYAAFGTELDRMSDRAGATERAYQTMLEQPVSQIQLLTNNWQILRHELGEALFPTLNRIVVVGQQIVDWFRNLSPETKRMIAIIGSATGAFLIFAGAITLLAGFFLILSAAGAGFLVTTGLIIAGVAAVAAVAILVINKWQPIKSFFVDLWDSIKSGASAAWQFLQEVWDSITAAVMTALGPAITWLRDTWNAVWAAVSAAVDVAWGIIRGIWAGIVAYVNRVIIPVFKTYKAFWTSVWNAVASVVKWVWNNVLSPIWNYIKSVINNTVIPAVKLAGQIFTVTWKTIATVVKVAWAIISTIFKIIITLIRAALAPVFRFLADFVRDQWDRIVFAVKVAWAVLSAVWNAIIGFVRRVFGPVFEWLVGYIRGRWDALVYAVQRVWGVIKGVWDSVINYVKGPFIAVFNWLSEKWSSIWDGLSSMASRVWSSIASAVRMNVNSIIGLIESMANAAIRGVNTLVDAVNRIPGVTAVPRIAEQRFTRMSGGTRPARAMQTGGRVLRAGMAVVGEAGPELLFLPRAAEVGSNRVLRQNAGMPGQQDVIRRLDTLIDIMRDREPIQLNVTTRDDPWDIGTKSVAIMRAVGG